MSGFEEPVSRQYFKYNYIEGLKKLIPSLYEDIEYLNHGEEDDLLYTVLSKLLYSGVNSDSIFNVSGFEASGYHPYFVPGNKKSTTTTSEFNKNILRAFDKSFGDFENKDSFEAFITDTVLPNIRINSPTSTFFTGASSRVVASVSGEPEAHQFLIDSLGILYFLNFSAASNFHADATWNPTEGVIKLIMDKLYLGKDITDSDTIQLFMESIWRNREDVAPFPPYLPHPYTLTDTELGEMSVEPEDLIQTLKVYIDILCNKNDAEFPHLLGYMEAYLNTQDLGGNLTIRREPGGPLFKFIRAMSYNFYDLKNLSNDLSNLLSIDKCPREFLDFLSHYIGWKLFTDDIESWRGQLRKAIYIYKAKGTRKALDTVLGLIFPDTVFDASNKKTGFVELWESYLPNLIYYALKTSSFVGSNYDEAFQFWSDAADPNGIGNPHDLTLNFCVFGEDKHDTMIRFMVDAILELLHKNTGCIVINNKPYTESEFWTSQTSPSYFHRNAAVVVPPWENTRFYDNAQITKPTIDLLETTLSANRENFGFEVDITTVNAIAAICREAIELQEGSFNFGLGRNSTFNMLSNEKRQAPTTDYTLSSISNNIDNISLLDTWNSKSSHVMASIDVSSIDFELPAVYTGGVLGKSAVMAIQEAFKSFAPFHVLLDLYLPSNIEDTETIEESSFCVQVASEVKDLGDDGYNLRGFTYSDYFGFSAPYARHGGSMPISTGFPSLNATPKQNTGQFIPKGFNFSSGEFFSTTGDAKASQIWDARYDIKMGRDSTCESSYVHNGVPVSSTFPVRGISDTENDCRSFTVFRDNIGESFEAMFSTDEGGSFWGGGGAQTRMPTFDPMSSRVGSFSAPVEDLWGYSVDFPVSANVVSGTSGTDVDLLSSHAKGSILDTQYFAHDPQFNLSCITRQDQYVIGSQGISNELVKGPGGRSVRLKPGKLRFGEHNTFSSRELGRLDYSNTNIIEGCARVVSTHSPDYIWYNNASGGMYSSQYPPNAVSFFARSPRTAAGPPMRLAFDLNRSENFLRNTNLIPAKDTSREFSYLHTRDTASWAAVDRYKLKAWNNNVGTASIAVSSVSDLDVSSVPVYAVTLQGKGAAEMMSRKCTGLITNQQAENENPKTPHVPGRTYRLSCKIKSSDGCELRAMVANTTRKEYYNFNSDSWVEYTDVSGLSGALFSSDTDWVEVYDDYTIDSTFSAADKYLIGFLPENTDAPGTYRYVQVAKPKLELLKAPKIHLDRDYELTLVGKSTNTADVSECVSVRIVTKSNPDAGGGNPSRRHQFNFSTHKWEAIEDIVYLGSAEVSGVSGTAVSATPDFFPDVTGFFDSSVSSISAYDSVSGVSGSLYVSSMGASATSGTDASGVSGSLYVSSMGASAVSPSVLGASGVSGSISGTAQTRVEPVSSIVKSPYWTKVCFSSSEFEKKLVTFNTRITAQVGEDAPYSNPPLDSNSSYCIEIGKSTSVNKNSFVTISEVSLRDLTLNALSSNYNKDTLTKVLTLFNANQTTKLSEFSAIEPVSVSGSTDTYTFTEPES